ncbi:MAG TPA: ABC transporter permease [Firmicutes bacterium]|nr:ABC transporter permease [Bacillota bacterium]
MFLVRASGPRIGTACLVMLTIAVTIGPLFLGWEYDRTDLWSRLHPPSGIHWFGTDDLGRDILTRSLLAGRISLLIGVAAAILSTALGTAVGAVAGYGPSWLDNVLMRFTDFMLSLPSLPLLLVVSKLFGGGLVNVILILCAFSWMPLARVVRAQMLSLKEREFAEAARALGCRPIRILVKHLVPNTLSVVIVDTSLRVGTAILTESSLSYLGLGVSPPTPTWGNMLANAQVYLTTAPWAAVFPGLMIFITVLSVNLVGDGLRDVLDPTIRGQGLPQKHSKLR